jgi:hypothetical protein
VLQVVEHDSDAVDSANTKGAPAPAMASEVSGHGKNTQRMVDITSFRVSRSIDCQ